MNIFVISEDPVECAQALDDKRLVKMPVESAQMLSTAISIHGGTSIYRAAWHKHPCTIWTAQNKSNFMWHLQLLKAMGDEFVIRYGHAHKSAELASSLERMADILPSGEQTTFANCSLFKEYSSVLEAYKETLRTKWNNDKRQPRWTNRTPPAWK